MNDQQHEDIDQAIAASPPSPHERGYFLVHALDAVARTHHITTNAKDVVEKILAELEKEL